MSDAFDPYYKWLAIPPEEQPPDLYRLVGATKYESNIDVISHAVDQRMAFVRTFQSGKNSAHSQALLNELSNARVTLLSPDKKAVYDEQLRARETLCAVPPPAYAELPPVEMPPSADYQYVYTPAVATAPAPSPAAVSRPVKARKAKQTTPVLPLAIGGVVVLLLAVVGGLWAAGLFGPAPIAEVTPSPKPAPKPAPIPEEVKPGPVPAETKKNEISQDQDTVQPADNVFRPKKKSRNTLPGNNKRFALRLSGNKTLEAPGQNEALALGRSFTVEAWVRANFNEQERQLWGTYPALQTGNTAHGWAVILGQAADQSPVARLKVFTGLPSPPDANVPFPRDGQFHHVAVSGTADMLTLSIDGKGVAQFGFPKPETPMATGTLSIGSPTSPADARTLVTDIKALRISSSARYNGVYQLPLLFPNDEQVVGLYDFNAPVSKEVVDQSSKQANLPIRDSEWLLLARDRGFAPTGGDDTEPSEMEATPVVANRPAEIDVLEHINVSRDVARGAAQKSTRNVLTLTGGSPCIVKISIDPGKEYELTAKVTRRQQDDMFGIGLLVDGQPCLLAFDTIPITGPYTGLELVEGMRLDNGDYPVDVHQGRLLEPGTAVTLRVAVKPNSVTAWCNDRQVFQWQGDASRLSMLDAFDTGGAPGLFVAAYESVFEISELKLKPGAAVQTPDLAVDLEPGELELGMSGPSAPRGTNPPPEAAALQKATAEMRELLKADFDKARAQPGERQPLAEKLAQLARTTSDNLPMQYVLWEEALKVATSAGNLPLALQTIDDQSRVFASEPWARKLKAVKEIGPLARTTPDHRQVAELALDLANGAAAEGQDSTAEQLYRIAFTAAGKAGDTKFKTQVSEALQAFAEIKKHADLAQQAGERLKTDPENPKANLALGRYLCFIKDDWNTGLPHLLKSGDATLQALAKAEEAAPADGAARIALGDQWWDAYTTTKGPDKTFMMSRAGYWYAQEVENATGLTKTRLTNRIAEADEKRPLKAATGSKRGRTINLLALIDADRDRISGNWRKQDGVLLTSQQLNFPKIYVPYIPPEEYDVRVVFSQPVFRNDVCMMLPKSNQQVVYCFAGSPCRFKLLCEPLNGGPNPTEVRTTIRLEPNRRYTAIMQVRNDGVRGFFEGKEVINYKTEYRDMMPDGWRRIPDSRRMAIGTDDPTAFFAIDVTEITGTGELLENE